MRWQTAMVLALVVAGVAVWMAVHKSDKDGNPVPVAPSVTAAAPSAEVVATPPPTASAVETAAPPASAAVAATGAPPPTDTPAVSAAPRPTGAAVTPAHTGSATRPTKTKHKGGEVIDPWAH